MVNGQEEGEKKQLVVPQGKQYPLVIEVLKESTESQAAATVDQSQIQLEMVSKQYITGKDVKIKSIKELRQKTDD